MSPHRYRGTVSYVGTAFHGWQVQKNAARTVQAALSHALSSLALANVRVEGASLERMRASAELLPGTRDFRIFAVRLVPGETTERTLHAVTVQEDGVRLSAVFRGDGFLRGMVRSMCGVLADAARGRVRPERARELLETGDRRLLSPKASAKGLTLVRVSYGE